MLYVDELHVPSATLQSSATSTYETLITKDITRAANLFCFNKIGNMPIIICASHVESRASSFTTKPGYEARFGLARSNIHSSDLHISTHDFHKPFIAIYVESFQMKMERSIPAKLNSKDKKN